MPSLIRADHPSIVPLANAIRAITTNPLQQIVMVNDISHLLVDYDDDERVFGALEFHATLDEMLARRRQAGWVYLRDDCDGRAVFAAHLLASLGIEWRLEASFWKEHAWVIARVNGNDYDLLDLRNDSPEAARLTYKLVGRWFVRPSHRPPAFAWRRAWAERTDRNLVVGQQLGMLTVDSTPNRMHERYATDWTLRSPGGRLSPVDDRLAIATMAGFPLGEPLQVRAIAGHLAPQPAPRTSTATASVTTSASTSVNP